MTGQGGYSLPDWPRKRLVYLPIVYGRLASKRLKALRLVEGGKRFRACTLKCGRALPALDGRGGGGICEEIAHGIELLFYYPEGINSWGSGEGNNHQL